MARAKKGNREHMRLKAGKKLAAIKPLTVSPSNFNIIKSTDVASANHSEIILRA
jgi:hypothetical protein